MTTKYILYGGHAKGKQNTKEFFQEMAHDISKKDIVILYVPFAKKGKEEQRKHFHWNKTISTQALPQKNVTFLASSETPQKFLDQTHNADIIFFGGGNDMLLISFLQQIPFSVLMEHLAGKVIAGSSAGANVLAKYYYTNDRQRVEEGLGILPIKTICHYTEDKLSRLEELENYKEHLTSFALPEDYFVVLS